MLRTNMDMSVNWANRCTRASVMTTLKAPIARGKPAAITPPKTMSNATISNGRVMISARRRSCSLATFRSEKMATPPVTQMSKSSPGRRASRISGTRSVAASMSASSNTKA